MKNRILLLAFTLITFNSFSQNLSFSEVLKLKEMSNAQVIVYLTSKGWDLTEEIEESQYDAMNVFSFGDESFISYYFSTEGVGVISFAFYSREVYSQYLAEIKKIGGTMLGSEKEEDGDIVEYYQNASLTFMVVTSTTENSFGEKSTFYIINIIDSE